jgi:glucokinase
MSYILGLDFGGTKLAAGLVEPSSGAVAASARCSTPAGGAEASLAAMLGLAHELLRSQEPGVRSPEHLVTRSPAHPLTRSPLHPLTGVGVSFGGPIEADGRTVRRSMHIPGWESFALADQLEQEFGVPALVANDADAAALAEQRFGAGHGVRHLLYLTVSTGIGGGVIVDGRLHRGEHAWAGEIGHMPLVYDGPPCPCGRHGCLESLASGLSIARAARERLRPDMYGGPSVAAPLSAIPSEQITARDVALAAAQGDPLACGVWDEAMRWLGLGIAAAANLLNPGRVVIGGGLTRAGPLLFDPLRQIVAARALDPAIEIVPAALGDEVGVLGGAALLIPV